jgi:hypothetical protein
VRIFQVTAGQASPDNLNGYNVVKIKYVKSQ